MSSVVTFLKRRFSSGDLQGELADKREQEGLPSFLRFGSSSTTTQNQPYQSTVPGQMQGQMASQLYSTRPTDATTQYSTGTSYTGMSGQYGTGGGGGGGMNPPQSQMTSATSASDISQQQQQPQQQQQYRGRSMYPSAPTSPNRSSSLASTFRGPMGSITGQISSTIMRGFSSAASTAQQMTAGRSGASKDHQKILLVIDDSQTDWSKYFRGKKILGEWDIRVEQAQFSEITMTAYSDQGCVISIHQDHTHSKALRSFKPDFVLLRQHASGSNEDWQPILTGLMYGGTQCLNTLHAVYNMKNRPWLFAHLLILRNRLGKENFPLISQTYYTKHNEMVLCVTDMNYICLLNSKQDETGHGVQRMEWVVAPAFPTIIKIGQGHKGEGKIKADSALVYQDVASMMIPGNSYATTEPYIDANCDLHIQKIGSNYKAFMRKSISGNWKSNTGSALLEKVPLNDKFRLWIDEVSRLFGGLDICSIDALQSKTGEYVIYEANGSDMTLYGDSQEMDRTEIAELVIQRMQAVCQPPATTTTIPKTPSLQAMPRSSDLDRVGAGFTTPTPAPTNPPMAQPFSSSQAPLSVTTNISQPTQSFTQPAQAQSQYQPQFSSSQTSQYSAQPSSQQQQPPQQQQQQPYRPPSSTGWSPSTQQPSKPIPGGSPGISSIGDYSIGSSPSSISSTHSATSVRTETPQQTGMSTPTGVRSYGSATDSIQSSGQSDYSFRPSMTNAHPPSTQPAPTPSDQWNHFSDTSSFGTSSTTAMGDTTKTGGFNPPSNQAGFGMASQPATSSSTIFDQSGSNKFGGMPNQQPFPPSMMKQAAGTPIQPTQASQNYPTPERPNVPPRQTSLRTGASVEDTDDTMKNLRKTFAGIFGDM